jgi:hypothetical protein
MATSGRAFLLAALGSALFFGVLAPRAGAAPGDGPKPAHAGGLYRNAQLGVTVHAPAGWMVLADKGQAPTTWKRLATFRDRQTGAQVVLSVRPRRAASLEDLVATVRADWKKTQAKLPMSSLQKVEASALSPAAKVIVDGSYVRKVEPKKSASGVPEPPSSISYHVQATYYLGPGYTYLLYASAREVHWSRVRVELERMRDGLRFDKKPESGPTGVGSYRNELVGFACTFPKDYTVVVPARENHMVRFMGVGEQDAILDVYAFHWEQGLDADAARLVSYYEGKGGTASTGPLEVAGQEGRLVTAKAVLAGKDSVVLIAILKRGPDVFRLRAQMPQESQAQGTAAFKAFVAGFRLGQPTPK